LIPPPEKKEDNKAPPQKTENKILIPPPEKKEDNKAPPQKTENKILIPPPEKKEDNKAPPQKTENKTLIPPPGKKEDNKAPPQKTENKTLIPPHLTFYWINLERAPHRRKRLEEEFKKRNVSNKRIEAIDGNTHTVELSKFIAEPYARHYGVEKYKYEIATSLSHLKALQTFVNDGADIGIICEDDLSFEYESLWRKSVEHLIKDAPPDWTVLQMALTVNDQKDWLAIKKANLSYHPRKENWYSALAYAIKRRHAIQILNHHSVPCDRPNFIARLKVDAIDKFQSERIVIGTKPGSYLVFPPVFTYPTKNDSFIHPNHLQMHEKSKKIITESPNEKH
jgi:GR25 family glycosyltransferase involved in LPS biosynthesis